MTDEMLTATDPEATPLDERAVPEAAPEETVTEPVEPDAAETASDETATAETATAETETEDTDDTVDASFDLSEDADAPTDDQAVAEEEVVDDPWTRPGAWYVVHTQSGYEKKVTANLHARIQSMNMEDKIFEVVIPMEEVDEFKNGRKQTVQKKVFPGYLLVRCVMDDDSLVLHPQHPGRHRLRRPEQAGSEAHAAVAPRGADVPCGQGRRHRRPAEPQEAQARLRSRRERAREGRPVRRLRRPRSPRSTPTT